MDKRRPEDRSHSAGRSERREGRKTRTKESSEGSRTPGLTASKQGQQQKPYCPLVYTQPHPSSRPRPDPFLALPSTSFSLFPLIGTNQDRLSFEVGGKRQAGGTCVVTGAELIGGTNGQLGANLQTLCSITA